ncbi:MAG TPA: PHP domain-containing protein [Bacteroidia bacterium]|nr:PHP domain-containing protein [Bacteroidia bacterium]
MTVKSETISNKEIARAFKLAAALLELHDDNPFKARSLQNAAFKVERLTTPLSEMQEEEIARLDGIGKGIQGKIKEYLDHSSFEELDILLEKTPPGVVQMLAIKGIGPKKVKVLWNELGLESPGELLYACNENRLVELKGFGTKTQDLIIKSIEYSRSNEGKFLYANIEIIAQQLEKDFKQSGLISEISFTGALRRRCEILEELEFVLSIPDLKAFLKFLEDHPLIDDGSVKSAGNRIESMVAGKLPLHIYRADDNNFYSTLFLTTAGEDHLQILKEKYALTDIGSAKSEEEIYTSLKLPFIEPELREGIFEFELAAKGAMPVLLELKDLKGILHNHSTYSDGEHSLEVMAKYCKELGYEYLGICDHSKSAFYANGLQPERIIMQHAEIEKLNASLAPFKIFKGIESDILIDGSLDYPPDILKTFDFIVASVHSSLRMDKEKATKRLITAIENPFTTILGHPTGRLLLAREGYPIDHKKVIDACAANGVILELNANPYRLDIDWRHIQYAISKNVMLSINPDAHRKEGYHDMYYGVCTARKGALTKNMTFNALSRDEVSDFFLKRSALRNK